MENNTFKSVVNYFKYRDEINEIDINYEKDDITTNKEVYQIELCQDGRFAATFDTANLRIKILQNTDYRPFIFNKKKNNLRNENDVEGSVEIDKTIAYFKINDDFGIEKLYDHNPPLFDDNKVEKETKKDNFRWSFDISNMYEKNDKCFVFVAISRINIDEDMKGTNKKKDDNGNSSYEREQLTQKIFKCPPSSNENDSVLNIPGSGTTQPESKKGIAIYRIELNRSYIISAVTCHYSNKISGLCKFIEVSSEEDSNKDYLSKYDYSELRRFIILNFRGIYNIEFDDNFDFLKLTEKFEYPQNFKIVLDNWLKFSGFADCTNRLLSCIYDKYFLVTRFNNGVQSLEVYNLAKMEHEVNARFVENIVNESYDYFFSVSGLQICFTQVNIVKLFLIENGLEIASKKFEELERIYLLEFIDSDKKLLIIGKGQGLKKGEDQKDEGLKVGKDLEEGKDQESNKDKEDKKVLKFIIWDLYNTGEHELVELYDFPITKTNMDDIYTRLAITSGNILQIDDYGKISSVLKKFEKEINKKKLDKAAGPKVPNLKKKIGKLNGKDDENHTIHYDEKVNFKQIVNDREPWLPGGSKRTSYCLYYNEEGTKTETLQLIVGRSTVQIWHQINDDSKNKDELPNKEEAFLEYIWSNRIPVKKEREITRLRIEKFEYGPNYGSKSKEYDFYLKVYWFESNDSSKPEEHTKMTEHEIIKKENDEIDEIEDKIKKITNENKDINEADKEKKSQEIINSCVKIKLREKVIKGKDVIKKSHAARHACKALEHIRKRYKSKSDADNYKYKRLTNYIEHIIWRFAKYEPEKFRLLDVRYNLMKSLILADCDRLIKFILFGYEETAKNKIDYRHVPSNKLWPGKKFLKDDDFNFGGERDHELKIPENNMELAIYYCRGRELKDAIIVSYLLEYYSRNPTNCVGWMCTVSKAIPLLFENKYDDFARKLFIRCFADQGHFSDEIITEGYRESLNHSDIKLRAFTPMVKLMSDKPKWYNRIWDTFKDFDSIFEESKNFETSLLALRVVPFPGFSVDNIPRERMKFTLTKFIFNILSLFVPRFYRILRNDIMKLSPFSRMVLCENFDIYDNPAIEAVINFHWKRARHFFFFTFFQFLVFFTCFGLVSWAYLDHSTIINHYFLFALIVVFYYLATYQVITESLQFNYRGFKKYLSEIYNIIDLISIIVAVTIMSTMVKNFQFFDGFGSVKETDLSLVVLISFSIFLLWIELILNLRLMPVIGIYVYHVIIIFKTIFPFILFILIIIFAFAHTMFVLLRNPIGIKTKDSTYSGVATNSLTNETLDIKLKSDFDPMSSDSNPFTSFSEAMMATYFWINGDWVQRDEFDYWAVDVFTLIASIFLVIVLQNMLIAYMSNAYEDVTARSRQILLRLQVGFIKDYVALQHLHFSEPEPEPKHIYYSSQADYFEEWYNTKSDNDKGPIYKSFEINSTLTLSSIFKKKDYDKYSILAYDDNNIKMIIEDYIKLVSDNTEDLIKRVIDSEEFEDMKIDLDHILEKLKKKIYKL